MLPQRGSLERPGPGGPLVKNLASSARDKGLIPGGEAKIPHVMEQISLHTATKSLCSQKEKKKKEAVQIVVDAQTLVLAFSKIVAAAATGPAWCSRSLVIERSGYGRHGGLGGSWEEARPSVRLQGRHHWDGQADARLEKALSTCCGARRPFFWW